MTPKQRRRRALLAWRWCTMRRYGGDLPPWTAEALEESLTCEALPDNFGSGHYQALVEFRHLTRKARLAACRRFLVFDRIHDPSCSYHVRIR